MSIYISITYTPKKVICIHVEKQALEMENSTKIYIKMVKQDHTSILKLQSLK